MPVTHSDDKSGFRPFQLNNSTGHISQQELLHPTERHHSIREEVSRIAVKIPPFWHARPELWFAQIESQFVSSGVTTEQTKFHTVVASIDGVILPQVTPTENPYSTLKKRLLKEFSISEQKILRKLLQDMDLGDLRPSQLLREMKNFAGT
ncbi:uncharacterized protein LOC119666205 [Teleopsis dalmanni]|uniref:uncharacterized protein LOC119666205 n=1 Tax=Teleopsis dalmanni TaxID=139649 RepID=UPI0018CCDB2B|nr:uncharacterized protein LOC119666205 [Teleopsis dalmanni]